MRIITKRRQRTCSRVEFQMIMYDAPHPGEILREWMADDIGVSQLAEHLGINRVTLSRLLNGNNGVTAPMAFKLAEAFPKTNAEFWLQLQINYDLSRAAREKRKPITPVRAA